MEQSFDDLVAKARQLAVSKGVDPDGVDSEVAFESLAALGNVVQQQAELKT